MEMEDLNVALVSIPYVVTGALVGRSTNVHAGTQQSEPSRHVVFRFTITIGISPAPSAESQSSLLPCLLGRHVVFVSFERVCGAKIFSA